MKKRLLAILLAVCLVVSLAPSVLAADNFTPVLPDGVTSESFANGTTVTDGTNYYATLIDALAGIHETENAVLYCKPEANVGTMTHGHVCRNLTIYGNGAYVSSGEQDFELDTFLCTGQSGSSLTGDVTLKVMNLDGCGAWGQRNSAYTLNIVFENCKDMNRVYISGTSGANNITLTGCSFAGSGDASGNASTCTLYSNANGAITVTDTTFNGVYAPINLNHKVSGTQTISISGCTFTSCGYSDYEYAAPIRVLSSVEGGSSVLTVSGCTFTETVTNAASQNADILLDYGVGTATATVSSTAANVLTETESNVGNSVSVSATESQSFRNYEPVAQIGDVKYATLREAINSAQTGDTVTLLRDITLTTPLAVTADKIVVLDLNGKTVSGANNGTQYASMIHVSNGASLTIKDSSAAANGKLTYALETGAGAVVWVEGKLILESGTIELTGNKQGYAVDIRPNAWDRAYTEDTSFVVNGGAVVSSSVGVRVSYNSSNSFAANSVDFIMTDGSVTGSYAVYVDKQSAGAWNLGVAVEGGTLTATHATYPSAIYVSNTDAGNVSLDLSDGIYNGDIALYTNSTLNEANVTISGGTYNGDYGIANYDENKPKVITGGTFKSNVTDFCVEGYACQVNPDGTYGVILDPGQSIFVAAIDGVGYTTLADAFKAATANCEIDILADVTISDTWDCRYNGAKFTVPVTIDGNGHTLKLTGAVDDKNWNTVFRFEADAVVKDLTIDASAATSIQRGISSKLSITVEDCTLIGNGTSAKRAIIYGEGAGTSISDVTATISRCTFTNWTYGVSDNQNGQDAKSVTITGSTFNNASVLVSASENVVFTRNTLDNGYVNINSYTVPNELTVEATDNTLEDDYAEYNSIKAANITAQDDFVTPVAEVGGKYYTSLEEAVSKAGSSLVTIIRDIVLDEPITIEAGTASSIDLNGNTITGTIKLADGATLTAGEGLTVTTDVEGMIVTYENGIYSLAVGYTVTYTDGVDGKELFADQINFVAAGSPTPAFVGTPTRSGYTFAGWTPEVSATVTEDVTYTATWSYDYPDIVIPTTYSVTVKDSIGGEVDANRSYATAGTIVKLTVTPDDGYELDTLTVKAGSREISTTYQNGTYNFTMPYANVTVTATFKKVDAPDVSDECPGDWTCPMYGYTDLDRTAWYHDGIHFCIENDLMQGIGNNQFDPNSTTTRAMIVTILWRLEGSPVVNYAMDFEDVAAGQWYTEAIRWAASEKIVAGYGNGNFGTNDAITREQMVTIMYRYAQYKGYDVSVGENTNILSYDDAFDVAEWAIPAMQWACGSGMIQGIEDGSAMNLAPQGNATRAQSAAILQRFCENVAEN